MGISDNVLYAIFWVSAAVLGSVIAICILLGTMRWYDTATPEKICASGGTNVIFCQQLIAKKQEGEK
jgi:hypothetical protein